MTLLVFSGSCLMLLLPLRQTSQLRGALWSFNCQNFFNVLSAAIAFVTLSLPREFNGKRTTADAISAAAYSTAAAAAAHG